jgi:hypothetical protein
MLGERIGAERGKVTSRWVLEGGDYRCLEMEVGFEATSVASG